jgi:hypothetical protein
MRIYHASEFLCAVAYLGENSEEGFTEIARSRLFELSRDKE